jgi:lysophospholipase L1-like esterase
MKRVPLCFLALVALIPVAGGVAVNKAYAQANVALSGPVQYAALGSSFGAGPGIGTSDPSSPVCHRSMENYAHLLAQKRGFKLTDATCSGATTKSILEPWRSLPAQLDAVGPHTSLVTITIGGNDVHFSTSLGVWSCMNAAHAGEQTPACGSIPAAPGDEAFAYLESNLRKIVEGIHQRSSNAKIVFVDYVTVLPLGGDCPGKLPLTSEELEQGQATAARLAAVTKKVADDTGSGLLQASELTKEHDVCSSDPWVNGAPSPSVMVPYHPNAKAMHAIADRLDRMLPSF